MYLDMYLTMRSLFSILSNVMARKVNLEFQTKVPELFRRGKKRKEISIELGIPLGTVDWYLDPERTARYYSNRRTPEKIRMQKLRVKSRREKSRRARTEFCELCGKDELPLHYHHWDDDNLKLGLWVCPGICHMFCEGIDKGLSVEKYTELKKLVTRNILDKEDLE